MPVYKLHGNGEYELQVVGESHYQTALASLCGPRTEEGEKKIVETVLVPEKNNRYDSNAVRVDVLGKTVGYLPRDEARDLRKIYKALKIPENTALVVSGKIVGGWIRDGKEGHYGVYLDFPLDEDGLEQLQKIASQSQKKSCFGIFLFLLASAFLATHLFV